MFLAELPNHQTIATLIPQKLRLIELLQIPKKNLSEEGVKKKACEIRFIKNTVLVRNVLPAATPRFTICQRIFVVNVQSGVTSTNSNRSWFSGIGFALDLWCGKEVSHELLWVAGFSIPLGSFRKLVKMAGSLMSSVSALALAQIWTFFPALFEIKIQVIQILVVATQTFFIFNPVWGRFPFWWSYFSDGLKPPPRNDTLRFFEGWWWIFPILCLLVEFRWYF